MKIKNAFQIFFKNYNLVLKVALTQLIIIAIFIGLGSLLINDMVVDVSTGLVQYGVVDNVDALIGEILSGDFSAERFIALFTELRQSIQIWSADVDFFYQKLTLSGFLVFVAFMLLTYCLNFYTVPFNQNVSDFMSTSAKIPFFWRFFKSFGISAKTQLLYIAIPFLLDIFILFGILGLYTTLLSILGLWGLIIAALLLLVMISLRKTLFAFWIPAMVINEMPVRASLREGVKTVTDGFGRVFWRILLVTLFTYSLIAVLLFGMVNLIMLIVVMFLALHNELFVSTVCMVEYYRQSNFGYYIDKMKAVDGDGQTTVNIEIPDIDEEDYF